MKKFIIVLSIILLSITNCFGVSIFKIKNINLYALTYVYDDYEVTTMFSDVRIFKVDNKYYFSLGGFANMNVGIDKENYDKIKKIMFKGE